MAADAPRRWTRDERFGFLLTVRLFAGLPVAVVREVAGRLRITHLERGEFAFTEGTPAVALCLLATGRIKIVGETEEGRDVILRVIGPGEIFGGAAGWGEPVYPASAVAIEPSTVLLAPAPVVAALLASSAPFALAVARELSTRLREAESRIRELQTERVERRLARTLLRLATKTGTKTAEGIELGLPLRRQDLAELAGTTLSTASRILSGWDERGIILAGRERVVLRTPHLLVAIADELPTDEPSADPMR